MPRVKFEAISYRVSSCDNALCLSSFSLKARGKLELGLDADYCHEPTLSAGQSATVMAALTERSVQSLSQSLLPVKIFKA